MDPKFCNREHCKYQVPDDRFICPKCGLGPDDGGLVLETPTLDYSDDCELMHNDDIVRCYQCGYEDLAGGFSKKVAKKERLVTCPTCKGKGVVRRKKK